MVLAIAAELDYEVYMLNVQTAFLHADVEEEGFVKIILATSAATSPEFHSS